MRVRAVTVIQALAWLTTASGFVAAPIAAADPSSAVSAVPGPQELMGDLTARLFAALDKESATVRHNADRVLPLVDKLLSPHFDKEYAGRLVLGLHWRGATPQQREQFAAALYRRLLRTYAGAVAEWTADRVKILPLRADPEALQVTVHTQVTDSRGSIVPVDFRLHQTAEGWKIFDVIVDGVSYVRNYHEDTDTEISQKGLDAAIARLERSDAASVERPLPEPHHP
jgi:phospholipid transport system substrate-binding protein